MLSHTEKKKPKPTTFTLDLTHDLSDTKHEKTLRHWASGRESFSWHVEVKQQVPVVWTADT